MTNLLYFVFVFLPNADFGFCYPHIFNLGSIMIMDDYGGHFVCLFACSDKQTNTRKGIKPWKEKLNPNYGLNFFLAFGFWCGYHNEWYRGNQTKQKISVCLHTNGIKFLLFISSSMIEIEEEKCD